MERTQRFFEALFQPGDLIQLRFIAPDNKVHSALATSPEQAAATAIAHKAEGHTYFGVCPRSEGGQVTAVRALWVDVDQKKVGSKKRALGLVQGFALPATMIVDTGGGYHGYWLLQEPCATDEATKQALQGLQLATEADPLADFERLLRVPGTLNPKYTPTRDVTLIETNPRAAWSLAAIRAAARFPAWWHAAIRSGDSTPWGDRSRRDWALCVQAIQAGMPEEDLQRIFELTAAGDKYQDAEIGGEKYFRVTYQAAMEFVQNKPLGSRDLDISEEGDTYWRGEGKRATQLTTWLYVPQALLLDSAKEYSWCGTVRVGADSWPDVVIPLRAFDRRQTLLSHMARPEWDFFGSDLDAVRLRAYIQQQTDELPEKRVVRSLGRHGDHWYHKTTVNLNRDVVCVPLGEPLFELEFGESYDLERVREIVQLLPKLNRPAVIWPVLGWFMASPFIQHQTGQYPMLNIFGTTGAGKSTLAAAFALALGYTTPRFFSVRQTAFVRLYALASTNAIPILFDEYRPSEMAPFERDQFHQLLIEAYNAVSHARGRPTLTVETFPLVAPLVVLGEEPVEVPALRSRMIQVAPRRDDVLSKSSYWTAYRQFADIPDKWHFASAYIPFTLSRKYDHTWMQQRAEQLLADYENIPDRVKHNTGVILWGVKNYLDFAAMVGAKVEPPADAALMEAVENVFDLARGEIRLAVDDFAEDVLNSIVNGEWQNVPAQLVDSKYLWVAKKPAYDAWVQHRVRTRQPAVDYRALSHQMEENHARNGYFTEPGKYKSINGQSVMAFCIDIQIASDYLATPVDFELNTITIRGGAGGLRQG